MKVFISWSGERSRRVAEALHSWLGDVIHFLEPWISTQDIYKGGRWLTDVSDQLCQSQFGIICLTQENMNAPWILFEAGALAKTLQEAFVCPYLLDVRPSDITGPIAQFQCALADRTDTFKLLSSLNRAVGSQALPETRLVRAFEKWWPELERHLQTCVGTDARAARAQRPEREIMEEILDTVRAQIRTRQGASEHGIVPQVQTFLEKVSSGSCEVGQPPIICQLTGADDDQNALNWADTVPLGQGDTLNGDWVGRWSFRATDKYWHAGHATLNALRDSVCILFDDIASQYLILAKRLERNRLIGHYISLQFPYDSSPWAGIIVDDTRIDGVWAGGRWDFRRRTPGTANQKATSGSCGGTQFCAV